MPKVSRSLILAAATGCASLVLATSAAAQSLKLTMANGRVTLIAQDVPIRQILAEWARVGDTRIVNGDKLVGAPLTLQLVDCPEGRALDLLLREAAGYMAAPRAANQPGVSVYDRIMILPTSRPPAVTATATPPPFNRNLMMPQPMPVPVEDNEDREPGDQGAVPPPGVVPQGMPVPGQPPFPAGVQGQPQQQPVLTAPRPGQLPMPAQPGVQNPYAPPGAVPPGAMPPGTVRPQTQPGVPQPGRPGGGPEGN